MARRVLLWMTNSPNDALLFLTHDYNTAVIMITCWTVTPRVSTPNSCRISIRRCSKWALASSYTSALPCCDSACGGDRLAGLRRRAIQSRHVRCILTHEAVVCMIELSARLPCLVALASVSIGSELSLSWQSWKFSSSLDSENQSASEHDPPPRSIISLKVVPSSDIVVSVSSRRRGWKSKSARQRLISASISASVTSLST